MHYLDRRAREHAAGREWRNHASPFVDDAADPEDDDSAFVPTLKHMYDSNLLPVLRMLSQTL